MFGSRGVLVAYRMSGAPGCGAERRGGRLSLLRSKANAEFYVSLFSFVG